MPTYRYYAADILTGNVIAELPLYGVYMDKRLSTAGNFNGTFRLGTGRYLDDALLDATQPGFRSIFCERDGELIWGGICWSRTYEALGKYCSITGQTYESIWDHVVFNEHVIQQQVEQVDIFQTLVNQIQAQASNNFGMTLSMPAASGIKRTILLPSYEFHFASDALSQLIGVDNGLEYTVDISASATPDLPTKTVRVGYPKLTAGTSAISEAYDFPGTIVNYWMPENASRGGVQAGVLGAGSGNKVLRAVAVDGDKVSAGYPMWWIVNSYPELGTQQQVTDRAREDLQTYGMPVKAPTFQLSQDHQFNSWNRLGDYFTVRVQDARFPDGQTFTNRLIGWSLSPQSTDSEEQLQFVVEGDDF